VSATTITSRVPPRRHLADRLGDNLLLGLTSLAVLAAIVVIGAIIFKVIDGARPAIAHFGLSFIGNTTWNPVRDVYGAGSFLYGTAVSSAMALLLATPIGVAIGLYLTMLSPRRAASVIAPLVEMLAAIPSVVLGLWGIIVLGPFLRNTLEPALHSAFGFIPLFGDPSTTGLGMFNAGLILTIMIVPIIASISRELFLRVPGELKEGALALGATQWEMVRGVVLGSARQGLVAAAILGLSRALGEAIAVTQVIGGGSESAIHASLFANGDTLASRIASQFVGATTKLQIAALFYLALMLLVIGLLANLAAQWTVHHFEVRYGGAH
jgi:phosphate transport system permease protein